MNPLSCPVARTTTNFKPAGPFVWFVCFVVELFGIPRRKVDWTTRNRSVHRYFLDHTLAVADIMVKLEVSSRADGHTQLIHPRRAHEPPILPAQRGSATAPRRPRHLRRLSWLHR